MKFIEILLRLCLLTLIIGISLAQQSCRTPNNVQGTCIPLMNCEYLLDIFNRSPRISASDREFLQKSGCGFQGKQPKVCCKPYTISDLPTPGICGTLSLTDRLLNAETATIYQYPWMALLEYRRGSETGFYCGGSIINENYILTAAHCVKGSATTGGYKLISIRLGENNLLTDPDCSQDDCADPVVDIPIGETIPHPTDDIALIRLAQPIQFTTWVKPICLPVSEKLRTKNFDGVTLDVAGFGRTETGKKSNVKLHLQMNATSLEYCSDAYTSYRRTYVNIDSKKICAGGEKAKDSCKGDSGGPLMDEDIFNGINPYTFLVGVVSYGPDPCGKEGVPGVYVRVNQYIDWMVNHMRH